eukprot:gene31854-41336_t
MRFAIVSTAAGGPEEELVKQPILKLEDHTVDKQIRGYLRIEITDSGAGIALENQSRVFNQFAQFNRNTLQGGGGSGLGLWICRNLAAMHGGAMHFRSDGEGLGSTFYVHLPVFHRRSDPEAEPTLVESIGDPRWAAIHPFDIKTDDDDNDNDPAGEVLEAVTDIEMGVKKLRVLIVDDSSANRPLVVHTKKEMGVVPAITRVKDRSSPTESLFGRRGEAILTKWRIPQPQIK